MMSCLLAGVIISLRGRFPQLAAGLFISSNILVVQFGTRIPALAFRTIIDRVHIHHLIGRDKSMFVVA